MDDNKLDFTSLEAMMKKCNLASSSKFHAMSLQDSISDTTEKIESLAKVSTTVNDAYGNSLAAIGNNDKVETFTNYGFQNDTLYWPLWLALYNDSWVFRKAIDKPAQDEVNCGISLLNEIQHIDKVYDLFEKYKTDLINLLQWGALFGGSVAVIMFEGFKSEDYGKAIDPKKIKGRRFKLYVTDRWYGCAQSSKMVSSMKDIDYGKPAYYDITFANSKSYRVHHSYVLRYEHRTAPRLIKMGQLQGWGYAEGAHILNELSRDDQLKASITSLVNKSLIEVIKMDGMRGVFMGADQGSMEQLTKRLEMVNWGRTYNSLTFLDKSDDYQQYQLSGLTGLSDLLEKNMWLVAAALDMSGILFGELKGGLSQESDANQRYATTIENRCNAYFRPVLQKFLKIIFLVLGIEESPKFKFNSLIKREENKLRVDAINSLSDTLQKLIDAGIISKYQFAVTLKTFMNNESIVLDISDEHLNKLKLEEEQAILDTISEIGKKRNTHIPEPDFSGSRVSSSFSRPEIPSTSSESFNENIREINENDESDTTEETSENTEETQEVL